jgi:hypothetical protein
MERVHQRPASVEVIAQRRCFQSQILGQSLTSFAGPEWRAVQAFATRVIVHDDFEPKYIAVAGSAHRMARVGVTIDMLRAAIAEQALPYAVKQDGGDPRNRERSASRLALPK